MPELVCQNTTSIISQPLNQLAPIAKSSSSTMPATFELSYDPDGKPNILRNAFSPRTISLLNVTRPHSIPGVVIRTDLRSMKPGKVNPISHPAPVGKVPTTKDEFVERAIDASSPITPATATVETSTKNTYNDWDTRNTDKRQISSNAAEQPCTQYVAIPPSTSPSQEEEQANMKRKVSSRQNETCASHACVPPPRTVHTNNYRRSTAAAHRRSRSRSCGPNSRRRSVSVTRGPRPGSHTVRTVRTMQYLEQYDCANDEEDDPRSSPPPSERPGHGRGADNTMSGGGGGSRGRRSATPFSREPAPMSSDDEDEDDDDSKSLAVANAERNVRAIVAIAQDPSLRSCLRESGGGTEAKNKAAAETRRSVRFSMMQGSVEQESSSTGTKSATAVTTFEEEVVEEPQASRRRNSRGKRAATPFVRRAALPTVDDDEDDSDDEAARMAGVGDEVTRQTRQTIRSYMQSSDQGQVRSVLRQVARSRSTKEDKRVRFTDMVTTCIISEEQTSPVRGGGLVARRRVTIV